MKKPKWNKIYSWLKTGAYLILAMSLLLSIAGAGITGTALADEKDVAGDKEAEEFQVAPVNPEFLEFLENPPEPFYGYIPPTMDLSHLSDIPVKTGGDFGVLPGSFDWRDTGKVTSIKNQDPCGTCWTFSTTSVLESAVLKGESSTYDFSEQSVALCADRSWVYLYDESDEPCQAGGNTYKASEVFIKKGAVLESCNPYNGSALQCDGSCLCDSCTPVKRVNGYRFITGDQNQTSLIKDAVYNYGPVTASFCYDDVHLRTHGTYGSVYDYAGTPTVNHGVSIIGWDDSVPHYETAGTGAWLVKNSWGTGWGNSGYFWLAYESSGMNEVSYLRYENYNPSAELLYWDEAGQRNSWGWSGSSVAQMASVFNAPNDCTLTDIEFWTTSNNAEYVINVYLDDNITDGLSNLAASTSGTCAEYGYYSVPLTTPPALVTGQTFIVEAKMNTPGYGFPIPVELQTGGYAEPPIQTGKCYARHYDEDAWFDLALSGPGYNTCIRAQVESAPVPQPDINVSPTSFDKSLSPGTSQSYPLSISNSGNAELTYTITDEDTTGMPAPTPEGEGELYSPPEYEAGTLPEATKSPPLSSKPNYPQENFGAGYDDALKYDDGTAESAHGWTGPGGLFAVRFSPLSYPAMLETAWIHIWSGWPDGDHEQFQVEVWDDNGGGGTPGTILGTTTTTATNWGWWGVDISSMGISISSGDFYIVYRQLTSNPDYEGLSIDTTSPDGRSWVHNGVSWNPVESSIFATACDYMIRCEVGGGNCSWLSESPDSGTVPVGPSVDSISVNFDATGLAAGSYSADIIVSSNDPGEPEVVVPVTLQVVNKADLVVSAKHEEWINFGAKTYNISYTVTNQGGLTSGICTTTIAVDSVPKKNISCPSLAPGATHSYTDGPFTMSGDSDTIRVCADGYDVVDESNEDNNCLENEWGTLVTGVTTDVNCNIMSGVSLQLFDSGGVTPIGSPATSDGSGDYSLAASVSTTGNYLVVASKAGYQDESQIVNISTLGQEYEVNFRGDHGLIAATTPGIGGLDYFLLCMNLYLEDWGDCNIGMDTFLAVMNAYLELW